MRGGRTHAARRRQDSSSAVSPVGHRSSSSKGERQGAHRHPPVGAVFPCHRRPVSDRLNIQRLKGISPPGLLDKVSVESLPVGPLRTHEDD